MLTIEKKIAQILTQLSNYCGLILVFKLGFRQAGEEH